MSGIRKMQISVVIIVVLVLAAVVGVPLVLVKNSQKATPSTNTTATRATNNSASTASSNQTSVFDKQQYSLSTPTSVWVIANKLRPLSPKTYTPTLGVPTMKLRLSSAADEMHVNSAMVGSLNNLGDAAKAAGLPLMLASGYRSYDTQVAVYANEVKTYGQAQADRESARPGYSEHQTGWAADLAPAAGNCVVEDCFADTPEGKWLAAHAYEYGFVIRYPQGQEATTGYRYEPWHIRYVGKNLAAELQRLGNPTLESFFGLPVAPNYAK